jgi:hypothetical protein
VLLGEFSVCRTENAFSGGNSHRIADRHADVYPNSRANAGILNINQMGTSRGPDGARAITSAAASGNERERIASGNPPAWCSIAEGTLKHEVVAAAPSRETVYRDWLCARIGAAAALGDTRLVSLRDARLWRRGEPGEGAAAQMHGRPRPRLGQRVAMGRREAVFEGVLEVRDVGSFRDLLAHGIGQHRAFGFGMLLLRPVDLD